MKDYDVVVVGAGLGGLSAATFLTKAGKRVLVVEQQNVPGGYASSFKRGRFEFEISLHELSGLGHEGRRGNLWRLLEQCGITERVEFLPIHDFYRAVFPDVDITLPATREGFEEALCRAFPKDADGIRGFVALMFDYAREALRANREGPQAVMQNPSAYPNLLTYMGQTVNDVLKSVVPDPKARAVIAQTWGYYCNPPGKLSFLIFALALASYLRFGPTHIKGRSQALSQAFVDLIEEGGGEVWLNNGARRILAADGRVRGVVTEDGTEINCPYVVCNVNPVITCLQLIGRDQVPSWYLRRLGAWSGGASTFNVYLGLDCPPSHLGLTTHEMFVNLDYDLDGQFEVMKAGPKADPTGLVFTTYNVVDPDFSPAGTSSVVLTAIAHADPWLALSPADYVAAKNRLADKYIGLAERVVPDIRQHIEVVEVATPLTNMRYTANVNGSIIGFDETFQGTGTVRLPNRGPLEGLYFGNAWVHIGGGYEPCIVSGYRASVEVLQDLEVGGRSAKVADTLERTLTEQATGAAEVGPATTEAQTLVARLHPRRLTLQVAEVIEETATAKTLRMVAANGQLPYFRAGQYINLFVDVDGVLTSRPYSIASPPGKPYYDLTVRRMPGGFVSHYLLDHAGPGAVFESTGPTGSFYHEPLMDTSDLVFLAGGSGITPFMSMIRETIEKELPLRIHLVYGNRVPSDIIFGDELRRLASQHENLKVDFVMSEPPEDWNGPRGFLDAEMISSLVGSVAGKTFYICGPAPMYGLCESALAQLHVSSGEEGLVRRVRKEVYGPPADVTQEPGWPSGLAPQTEFQVHEERSGRTIKAIAGETLMASLERAGIVVPAVCRSGECSACRTRLMEGRVFAPARVQRRWADEKAGYIHPCMSYPLEDLRIRI